MYVQVPSLLYARTSAALPVAGGQFRSLAEPWTDTATSTGRLMIAILGGLADVERDLIRTRTAEGRSRVKARGKHMGRTPSLTPQQQAEARQRRAEGATLKELARSYNVSMATISRLRIWGRHPHRIDAAKHMTVAARIDSARRARASSMLRHSMRSHSGIRFS